jgi:hypothetical protein
MPTTEKSLTQPTKKWYNDANVCLEVGTKISSVQFTKGIPRALPVRPYSTRITSILILLSILSFYSGCSYSTDNRITGNLHTYSVKGLQDNDTIPDSWWEIEGRIEQEKLCRVKFHNLYNRNFYMVVEGRVGHTSKKYPVILDTGASQSIIVEEAHISAHNLPTYSADNDIVNSSGKSFGLCYLPELNIGEITLSNLPGLYLKRKSSFNPLKLLAPRKKIVIVGLQTLMKFKYIMFDNPQKEVELSKKQLFRPKNRSLWTRYSFEIERDLGGNAFLFITVPIAGEEITLQLDTGNGRGLAIKEELWGKLSDSLGHIKLTKNKDLYPYIGNLACKRGVIPRFKVADLTVRDAKISVFPDDSPLVEDCEGLLGMQCFQDTTIVLDFERNLMWIKKTDNQV